MLWLGVPRTGLRTTELEDRIHWIIATLSLRMPTKPAHYRLLANRTMLPFFSHQIAMLQAALDDVDWDMFRASSSDVSEFTDVAVSFVNTLTEQATESITVRTFPNQKPWVDRTIRDAVNKRTAAYSEALLSGNMSEYRSVSWGPALTSLPVCSLQSSMSPLLPLWFPPPSKNPSSSLCLRTINPLAWMTIVQWPSHQ